MSDLLANYKQFEKQLLDFIPKGKKKFSTVNNLRLERIEFLLRLLGDPHCTYPTVHVGGTSGKGTTATMIASILSSAGYKVGLHVSPHLQLFNERCQINGKVAPLSKLYSLLDKINPYIDEVAVCLGMGKPSYFEVQVALALLYFQQEAVDIAVVEVGLGGRLDATNVLPAEVAVLTSVGLDHTEVLGETLEEIAREKAGIIKMGQKVVCGFTQPEAQKKVSEAVAEKGGSLWMIEKDFSYDEKEHGQFSLTLPNAFFPSLQLAIPCEFQRQNAACAVAASMRLKDFSIPPQAVIDGIAQSALIGRMEIVQDSPHVLLDGAHNPDKIEALSRVVHHLFPHQNCLMVFALKQEKDIESSLRKLLNFPLTSVVFTQFSPIGLWEAVSPLVLTNVFKRLAPHVPVYTENNPTEAVNQAIPLAIKEQSVLIISGSLYLVGELRQRWHPLEKLLREAESCSLQ